MAESDGASFSDDEARGDGAAKTPRRARIGVIVNRKSHRNKAGLAPLPDDDDAMLVRYPDQREDLDGALEDFARAGIDLLAISGGDGTVRDVLTRGMQVFGDNWPPLLIVPQGKTNALAVNLGYSQAPPADRWRAMLAAGRFERRRPLALETIKQGARRRTVYGFLFGAGVFNAAIDAGQTAHRFGAFQAFAVGVTAVYGIAQAVLGIGRSRWRSLSRMTITSGPEETPLPAYSGDPECGRYLVGFSTLRKFPLGIRPFAGSGPSAGVDYFVLDRPSRLAVALLPVALTGSDTETMRKAGMHRGTGSEFRVALADGFILDGEAFPAGTYRISAGPDLAFLVP